MPTEDLPPLPGLRAFEAAARLGSIKAAAAELSVTPGAVSQQIKALEQHLGLPLFDRKNRSIQLTGAGRELQPKVTSAFAQIQKVVENVRPTKAPQLRISADPAIVSKWLLPRLNSFTADHPGVKVSIESTIGSEHAGIEGPDVFVLCAAAPPAELHSALLHQELILPVATSAWLEGNRVSHAKDLARAQLLHDTSLSLHGKPSSLEHWARKAGIAGLLDLSNAISFEASAAGQVVDAAIAGAGLAIGRSLLVFSALADGRLTCPFGPAVTTGLNYYVCCRKGHETLRYVDEFKSWALREARILSTLAAMSRA